MLNQIFHIYRKDNGKVVNHSLTVEEIEILIAERKIDWKKWEVQPCGIESEYADASY